MHGIDNRSRKRIGHNVALACDVLDAGGVLGDGREMSLLASGPRVGHFGESEREWFVVGVCRKFSTFEEVSEVTYAKMKGKKFPIEGAVLPFRSAELPTEEC